MGLINFKNQWGAAGAGLDQQRSDLFYVLMSFPSLLRESQGTSLWDQEVAFAVQEFPFPERSRETMPVKYLQQTNHQIGGDTASGSVDMTIRYAFNRRTAELLERWHWLVANPANGGVGLSSAVKTNGYFFWLTPNMQKLANVDDTSETNVMTLGARYRLEGVWIKGLKPSNADMTQANQGVTLSVSFQIDRYYPENIKDLNPNSFANLPSLGLSNIVAGLRNPGPAGQ
jgi:hypothetical protein